MTTARQHYSRAGARRQLKANAWVVVVIAAQLERIATEPCLTDAEHDELADLGQACRRVAEDLHERAGHA